MSDERDDLQNLLKDPGWLRFAQAQESYWKDALLTAIAGAANDRDDAVALGKIRQIVAAQQAVLRCLAWPAERVRALTEQDRQADRVPSLSRGGF